MDGFISHGFELVLRCRCVAPDFAGKFFTAKRLWSKKIIKATLYENKKDGAKDRIVLSFLASKAKFNPQIFLLCNVCFQGIGLCVFHRSNISVQSGAFIWSIFYTISNYVPEKFRSVKAAKP